MKLILFLYLSFTLLAGKTAWTERAAYTTIGINILDAKSTFNKGKVVVKKTGLVSKKVAKKVVGK